MEGQSFDRLTRGLGEGKSRRTVLQGLAASVLAGGLGWLGLEDAAAKTCKNHGRRCKKNKDCCSHKCKVKNGQKRGKCRGNGDPVCLRNGAVCPDGSSESCCSGFCTQEGPFGEVEPTCCVPNDETCKRNSDCCATASDPSACQGGRCCREEGATCATPSGLQIAQCCGLLGCDTDGTHTCVPTISP